MSATSPPSRTSSGFGSAPSSSTSSRSRDGSSSRSGPVVRASLPAAAGLRDADDRGADDEPDQSQRHERGTPGEERHEHARHHESARGADELAALHPADDPTAHVGRDQVTDDRRDRRTARRREDAEGAAGDEQHRQGQRRRREAHGHAPDHDADDEDRDPARPVGQHADRDRGQTAHDAERAREQSDRAVADVELTLEGGGEHAERGAVRGVEREDRRERDEHAPVGAEVGVVRATTTHRFAATAEHAPRLDHGKGLPEARGTPTTSAYPSRRGLDGRSGAWRSARSQNSMCSWPSGAPRRRRGNSVRFSAAGCSTTATTRLAMNRADRTT